VFRSVEGRKNPICRAQAALLELGELPQAPRWKRYDPFCPFLIERQRSTRNRTTRGGTQTMSLSEIVRRGWDAIGSGDFDTLVADYIEDMTFVMPSQTNVLEGRAAFRAALDGLCDILPPGFEITGQRHFEAEDEVVSIVEWKSEKIAGSQLAILFRFKSDKIYEERWFVDTEQWKSAF
jgi:ketosteroid isomerase-like protein